MKSKISMYQASLILLCSTGLMNHVIIIPVLLDDAGRDGWISALVAEGFVIALLPMIVYTWKKIKNDGIIHRLTHSAPKALWWGLAGLNTLYVSLLMMITLRETVTFHTYYLPQTPSWIPVLLFLIVSAYNAYKGLMNIAYTAAILLPFVMVFGFFVATANLPYKDYGELLPILEHGWKPVLLGAVKAGAGLLEIALLLLFREEVYEKTKSWRSFLLLSLVLTVLTLGPFVGAVAEFGVPEAQLMRYPAFEEWRLVKLGYYLEHVDFLSIFQWMSGTYIRLSVSLYACIRLLAPRSRRAQGWWLAATSLFVFAGLRMHISDMTYYAWLGSFILPGIFALLVLFLLACWVYALRLRPSTGGEEDEKAVS